MNDETDLHREEMAEAEIIRESLSCPSGERPRESESPASAFAVAGGCLSVSDAVLLILRWEDAAAERQKLATESRAKGDIDGALWLENGANAYDRCARELRGMTKLTNWRLPTDNQRLSVPAHE